MDVEVNMKAKIYSDGGSRGNPGPSAIGFVIKTEDRILLEYAAPIGNATNNVAEYQAVKKALQMAKEYGITEIELFLDSELVQKQLQGIYKIKSPDLLPIYSEVKMQTKQFKQFTANHVQRKYNKDADRLVNEALDTGKEIRRESSISDAATNMDRTSTIVSNGPKTATDKPEEANTPYENIAPNHSLQEWFQKRNIMLYSLRRDENHIRLGVRKEDVPKFIFFFDEFNFMVQQTGITKILIEYEVM